MRVYGGELGYIGAWRRRFDDALSLKSLPPELVEPITQTRDDLIRQQDVLIEKIVDAIEKSREYRTMEVMNDGTMGPHEQEIEELQVLSGSVAKRAIEELESILGSELLAELIIEKEALNNAQKNMASIVTDRRGRAVMHEELASESSLLAVSKQKDKHLPNPASPSDYKHFVSLLELATEDQFIVDTLYQEYRDKYDSILYKPLQDEEISDSVNEEEIRQQRIDELQRIDNRLFDDVGLIINSQKQKNTQQRLRLLRTRTIYRHLIETYSPSWREQQANIDLVGLLHKTQIDGLDVSDLDEAFTSYEDQTLPLLIERLEITKKSNKRLDSMQRASKANASSAVNQAMRKKWQESQQALSKNNLQLSKVSEEHLEQIKSKLPANVAQQLQYSYNEIVYPRMFRESKNVDRKIKAALSIPDISETQQGQIKVIADKFHYKYLRLAEQGIKLKRQVDNDRSSFSMGIPSHEVVMRELNKERLEFERDEACDRAIMQLQIVLGETQRQALQQISNW